MIGPDPAGLRELLTMLREFGVRRFQNPDGLVLELGPPVRPDAPAQDLEKLRKERQQHEEDLLYASSEGFQR